MKPVTRGSDTRRVSEATVDVADLRSLRGGRPASDEPQSDAPLREDIRTLGRVLGEVIGEQAGQDVLDLVESTRVEAFKIRRSEVDREELAARLGGLDIRSANHVIRAFSHFSLLANLAEDIHHERRRRFHRREGSPPQKGSLAAAFQAIDAADLDPDVVARELTGALVCPVVTAHPTEVRRKTISEVQRQVADLIRERDRAAAGEIDETQWSAQLWRSVLTLWQTALLRLSRLRLQDEIDEALRYYELSLFEVDPGDQRRAAAGAGRAVPRRRPAAPADAAARLLDRRRPRRQPLRHRRRPAPGHQPAGRRGVRSPPRRSSSACAPSCRCPTGWSPRPRSCTPWPRPAGTTRRSAPTSPTAARSTASPRGWRPPRTPCSAGSPVRRRRPRRSRRTTRPTSCAPTSTSSTNRCAATAPGALADDRLLRLREAVEVFGFHLCGLDMRQNAAVHEEVLAELLAWAGVCDDYAALDEAQRVELLAGELTMRRPLVRPDAELSDTARGSSTC